MNSRTSTHLSEVIRHFLSRQPLAVVATQGVSGPEAALVAFAETKTLELIFQTFVDSRKYQNLLQNPLVALVIGWDEQEHITVQYEGRAVEMTGDAADPYRDILQSKKTPCSAAFTCHEKSRLFKVSPIWIGYSDYTKDPPFVDELSLPSLMPKKQPTYHQTT